MRPAICQRVAMPHVITAKPSTVPTLATQRSFQRSRSSVMPAAMAAGSRRIHAQNGVLTAL
jgi:hypothetical protein